MLAAARAKAAETLLRLRLELERLPSEAVARRSGTCSRRELE